jgi:hypothetical protein
MIGLRFKAVLSGRGASERPSPGGLEWHHDCRYYRASLSRDSQNLGRISSDHCITAGLTTGPESPPPRNEVERQPNPRPNLSESERVFRWTAACGVLAGAAGAAG